MPTDSLVPNESGVRGTREPFLSAALIALVTITAVMLFSLFTLTEPHPPVRIPLFGLAPFLGASLAVGLAALDLLRRGHGAVWIPALIFAATAALSFGPQKYVDPAFPQIWPAVLTAQICIVVIVIRSVKLVRSP